MAQTKKNINWITTGFMIVFHVGAIAALFMFSWKALFVGLLFYWIAGSLGIGMGYHRLLTHRGYKCPKWLEYFLTVCATLSLEGGPIFWVATHRVHHQLTDKPGDPHSPRDGGFWAHMGWILTGQTFHNKSTDLLRLRSRPSQRQVSSLDQQVSLGTDHRIGLSAAGDWRLAIRFLGSVPAHGIAAALDLVREFGHAHVGLQALCHRRRLAQLVVGRLSQLSAKAGTTIITPIHSRRVMAWPGTSST